MLQKPEPYIKVLKSLQTNNTLKHERTFSENSQADSAAENSAKPSEMYAGDEWSACSEGGISDEGSEKESFDERAGLGLK